MKTEFTVSVNDDGDWVVTGAEEAAVLPMFENLVSDYEPNCLAHGFQTEAWFWLDKDWTYRFVIENGVAVFKDSVYKDGWEHGDEYEAEAVFNAFGVE